MPAEIFVHNFSTSHKFSIYHVSFMRVMFNFNIMWTKKMGHIIPKIIILNSHLLFFSSFFFLLFLLVPRFLSLAHRRIENCVSFYIFQFSCWLHDCAYEWHRELKSKELKIYIKHQCVYLISYSLTRCYGNIFIYLFCVVVAAADAVAVVLVGCTYIIVHFGIIFISFLLYITFLCYLLAFAIQSVLFK